MKNDPVTWLVANTASGSSNTDAITRVRDALATSGRKPDRIIDIQAEPCPDVADLRDAGVDLLTVFAGDGTVNGLVTRLEGWEGDVLVLPGGTANLLAHALHGERDAAETAASVRHLHRVRRPAIHSSQGPALIELLAGPGAVWSDVREGLRDGDLAEIALSGAEAVRQSVAGPMVRLVQPPLGRDEGYAGIRLAPQDGLIGVSGYGAETFGDYLRQGVALLLRDYREGPHDRLGCHGAVVCRSLDDAPIELMVDGERRTGAPEERFSLAELAVNLLAAADG